MHVAILHNFDHDLLDDDPGREARKDVTRVAAAMLEALNHDDLSAEPISVGRDVFAFIDVLQRRRPDVVVNLCESLAADSRGEMAVPCVLDLLRIPYTGSSALALGLCLHKDKTKELLRGRGVPTPGFRVVQATADALSVDLPFPLIVKPSREDGSVGIDFDSVVHDPLSLTRAVARIHRTFHQPALVEEYVDGREIYVPLLGNTPRRPLPLTEIHFSGVFEGRPHVLSYSAKWDKTSSEFVDSPSVPCSLTDELASQVRKTALEAFAAVDCRDYGRVDIRLAASGKPYVIDINPNCDLHPEAGFARAVQAAGIDYRSLARTLVEIALERRHGSSTHRREGQRGSRRIGATGRNLLTARGGRRARAHRPRAQGQ